MRKNKHLNNKVDMVTKTYNLLYDDVRDLKSVYLHLEYEVGNVWEDEEFDTLFDLLDDVWDYWTNMAHKGRLKR